MTKLIRVEAFDKETYGANSQIHFAFMSSPEDGRKQCHKWLTCRDFLNDAMRAHVNKDNKYDFSSHYKYGENPPIDMDKLRLLVSIRFNNDKDPAINKFKEKLFAGKRIINMYEDMAGWDESRITTVHHSLREKKVWLLTGPKEWMVSSHMVSMITLILRVATSYGPLDVEDEKALAKCWKALVKGHEKEKKGGFYALDRDLSDYIKGCEAKFPLLMKNYDKIFGNIKQEELFPEKAENFHSGGGIFSLCSHGTGIKKLDDLCATHLAGGK